MDFKKKRVVMENDSNSFKLTSTILFIIMWEVMSIKRDPFVDFFLYIIALGLTQITYRITKHVIGWRAVK